MIAEPLTRELWLQKNGFKHPQQDEAQDPFMRYAYQAESDPWRVECFEEFPYYSEIKGTVLSPGPVLVCAPRGGGKSALRYQIALDLENSLKTEGGRYLAVAYQDFEHLLGSVDNDPNKIKLRDHITNIIGLIVARLFDLSLKRPSVIDFKRLTKEQKWLLRWYIINFAKHLHYREINKYLGGVFGLDYYVNAENVVKVLLSLLKTIPSAKESLGTITEILTTWPMHEADPLDIQTQDLLLSILEICKTCDIDAVYVLIDNLDSAEMQGARNDFQLAFQIVKPLCSTAALQHLHNIPGLIVKIFTPEEIWSLIEKEGFRHELGVRHIEWQPEHMGDAAPLLQVWRKRLSVYSGGLYTSLSPLVEEQIAYNIDKWIVEAAQTPRELLFLGDAMLAHHFCYPSKDPLLTIKDWDFAYRELARYRKDGRKSSLENRENESEECEQLKKDLEQAERVLSVYQLKAYNYETLTTPSDFQSIIEEKQREFDELSRKYREQCAGKQKEKENDK